MSTGKQCIFCRQVVGLSQVSTHLTNSHSELADFVFSNEDNDSLSLLEMAELFEEKIMETAVVDSDEIRPPTDIFFSMAISPNSFQNAVTGNYGDGGRLSKAEFRQFYTSVETYVSGYLLDRAQFLADLGRVLLMNDASVNDNDAGSVNLIGRPAVNGAGALPIVKTVPWAAILSNANKATADNSHTITWRRIARLLAPELYKAITDGTAYADLLTMGTPLSQRFRIPHKYFYTSLSFFAAMRDPGSWTDDERKFSEFVVKNTVVRPSESGPYNMSPVSEEDIHNLGAIHARNERNRATATSANSRYSVGSTMYEKMYNMPVRTPREGLGYAE